MGRLIRRALVLIVVGGLVCGALNFHVVRANDGWYLVPKTKSTLADSYVDVRKFGISDWLEHRDLSTAILSAKKDQLFGQTPTDKLRGEWEAALEKLKEVGK